MSEVHVEEHSTLIKTPQQLIVVVLLAFLIPVIGIVMIASFATGGLKVDSNNSDASAAAVAERLKPVGTVVIGEVPASAAGAQPAGATPAVKSASGEPVKTAAASGADAGKKLYDTVCMACHAAGSGRNRSCLRNIANSAGRLRDVPLRNFCSHKAALALHP